MSLINCVAWNCRQSPRYSRQNTRKNQPSTPLHPHGQIRSNNSTTVDLTSLARSRTPFQGAPTQRSNVDVSPMDRLDSVTRIFFEMQRDFKSSIAAS